QTCALPISIITSLAEAQAMGAMALFGEKYGERVRVVKIGEWSIELCGGTHVSSSASLGMFKVVEETGVAAGVRRVEAVTGKGALQFVRAQEETLADASRKLQVAPEQLPQQIDKLLGTVKELEREVNRLKARLAGAFVDSLVSRAQDAGGVKVVAESVDGLDREGLRALGDRLKEALGPAVIVLGSATGGSVQMVAMATPEDRKSTRLNSSHVKKSYAVFCLKKKNQKQRARTIQAMPAVWTICLRFSRGERNREVSAA